MGGKWLGSYLPFYCFGYGSNIMLILIGGTSHTGKTTLARQLAIDRGLPFISTDYLANHPGRPWRDDDNEPVPDHVMRYYRELPLRKLLASVLTHYRGLFPTITSLIEEYLDKGGVIVEGSALLPEYVEALPYEPIELHWLTASEQSLKDRIYSNARYDGRRTEEQYVIDKFIIRCVSFDRELRSLRGAGSL